MRVRITFENVPNKNKGLTTFTHESPDVSVPPPIDSTIYYNSPPNGDEDPKGPFYSRVVSVQLCFNPASTFYLVRAAFIGFDS